MAATNSQGIQQEAENRMQKSLETLKHEFSSVRTGRASAAVLETVRIDYYGSQVPIHQAASIGVPDSHTLEIKPWETNLLPEIEKSILKANLGLTPMNDGKLIRLGFPPLTEERRRELVKQVHKMAEDLKVEIRTHRRKAIEALKGLKKDKALGEDDEKTAETRIQKLTDDYTAKIEQLTKTKEKELLEI